MKKNEVTKSTIALGHTERAFLAFEDLFSSFGMLLGVRFGEPHPSEEIRTGLRLMLSLYPRMRSLLEPTLFSYCLRLLDDADPRVEKLFDRSFQVVRGISPDTHAFFAYRKRFFNEPFSLEQALPLKIRYFPDSEKPVLLMSLHHIISDGLGFMNVVDDLMAWLNRQVPLGAPIDTRRVWKTFIKKPVHKIPGDFLRSLKQYQGAVMRTRHDKPLLLSSQPVDFFGEADIVTHVLPFDRERVLSTARKFNCSLTVLIMTALSRALVKLAPRQDANKIGLTTVIGLRPRFDDPKPVFGNYVMLKMLNIYKDIWDRPDKIISEIKNQMATRIREASGQETMAPWFIGKSAVLLGRKNYGKGVMHAKKSGKMAFSFQVSTGGSLDRLNAHGDRAHVTEIVDAVPHYGLFITLTSLDGRISTNFTYPLPELKREDLTQFIMVFDKEVGNLIQAAGL